MAATKRVPLALTISTDQYTADDSIGGLLTFDISALSQGSLLNKIIVNDDDNVKAAFELWLFNAAPTAIDDNDACALDGDDRDLVITIIPIATTDYRTLNSGAIAVIKQINDIVPLGTALYGYLLPTGTPTFTHTTALRVALDFVPEARGKY